MFPASWQHAIAAVFSGVGVTWIKARGLVQAYPGTALALWPVSVAATWWWL